MRESKHFYYTASRSNPPAKVPDAQLRALDRRQALDKQQRAFAISIVRAKLPWPSKPPG